MLGSNCHHLRAFLEINTGCDSKCRLCDYWRDNDPSELSPDAVTNTIVPFLARMEIDRVSITGGEPTLHPGLPDIAASLHEAGFPITLISSTTNLANVFDQIEAYVDTFMLSLDGVNKSQYIKTRGIDLFDQVIAWPSDIKRRSGGRSQVLISSVIQKANVLDLENLYDISRTSGADGLSFRVPDTTSHAFGRSGVVSDATLAASRFEPEELASVEAQLTRLLKRDEEINHLNQDRDFLLSIPDRLRALTDGTPRTDRKRCWAPQSSLVITANQRVKPCFYLPASFSVTSNGAHDPLIGLTEVSDGMASGEHPYRTHCSWCSQFEHSKASGETGSPV